ncbi:MAG: hypothetical protein V1659_04685, partial [Candidatus Woesearchaeota archaeon]
KRRFSSGINRRIEQREYTDAMDWLSFHVAQFQREKGKSEKQYDESSQRIEDVRAEILQDGLVLQIRRKTLCSLQEFLDSLKSDQQKASENGDFQSAQKWSKALYAYQRDLPKYQTDIMQLESQLETKGSQLSQAKATRLIAYKNIILFSKAEIIFREFQKRIKDMYTLTMTHKQEMTLSNVAGGLARFNPVQGRMNDCTKAYADLADSLPSDIDQLASLPSDLDDRCEKFFTNLTRSNEEMYSRAMSVFEKVKSGAM